jgi:hypothetical protein
MESTVVEVLIVHGLGEDSFYKMVNYNGRKILVGFEGPRGGDA